MNKLNGKRSVGIVNRARKSGAGKSAGSRLRVLMKNSATWAVPLIQMAARDIALKRGLKVDSRRLELSLMRSVAQGGLRRSGTFWGR